MRSLRKPYKQQEDKLEKDIQSEIETAINKSGLARVWRQNSGTAQRGGYWIRLSRKGSADLTGITRYGKRIEVEIKREGEKQNEDQVKFQIEVEKWGGIYILAHSLEEALSEIKRRLNVTPK